jgi:hypothetical protein
MTSFRVPRVAAENKKVSCQSPIVKLFTSVVQREAKSWVTGKAEQKCRNPRGF